MHTFPDDTRLLLASASPRRAELLRAAGFTFDIQPANADESVHAGEAAAAYVQRVAEAKARVVLPAAGDRVVLAADTTVVVNGQIFGKPDDERDAVRMLRALRSRRHEVLTAVTLATRIRTLTRVEQTMVEFGPMSDREIEWYVASGEPSDRAGAYAVQGLASRFVTRVDGSYSNVVGLPVAVVYEMLKEFAIQ
jgi:septum formation protein